MYNGEVDVAEPARRGWWRDDRLPLGATATATKMAKNTRPKKKPDRQPKDVVAEIRRRRKAGHPLRSGANRGDWIYAAAARHFGSWGAAVKAAGYDYAEDRRIPLTKDELRHQKDCHCFSADRRPDPLTKDEVLQRIRSAVARGEPLRAARDTLLASGGRHHFGSWKAAVEAAGFEAVRFPKWTAETVVARIRADLRSGLSVFASDVIAREWTMYQAGRRRFGSWGAALKAADPSLPKRRPGRPRMRSRPAVVKKRRRSTR